MVYGTGKSSLSSCCGSINSKRDYCIKKVNKFNKDFSSTKKYLNKNKYSLGSISTGYGISR